MSAIAYTTPIITWRTDLSVEMVAPALKSIAQAEQFSSTATPAVRSLGASIVDDFAEDLRRLADA
jgi:hypothetical protein